LPTASSVLLSVMPSSSPTRMTATTHNLPHISPVMPLTGAQFVDASQSIPTNRQPMNRPPSPSLNLLSAPPSPGDAPNMTAITSNLPHISSAIPLAGAQYVDSSHSVFNTARRDIHITNHNYPPINRMCSFIIYFLFTFAFD
jgi:hypothetical protein